MLNELDIKPFTQSEIIGNPSILTVILPKDKCSSPISKSNHTVIAIIKSREQDFISTHMSRTYTIKIPQRVI